MDVRRRRRLRAPINHERWLVSYADFVTLLFAFFTTMYAISTVDARKLTQVVDSMQAAFAKGDLPAPPERIGAGTSPGHATPSSSRAVHPTLVTPPAVPIAELKAHLGASLDEQIAGGLVDLEVDPRGLVVSIREAGSFPTGSADLSLVARGLLAEVAGAIRRFGNFVRVEGHTDDVPIHTPRFASNWELSTARATSVVAFLVAQGVEPERLSAAGYAEFHPRGPNDTDASRARNRRIDLVILNPLTVSREEPIPTRMKEGG
jgi:chemotaxis protein MotB